MISKKFRGIRLLSLITLLFLTFSILLTVRYSKKGLFIKTRAQSPNTVEVIFDGNPKTLVEKVIAEIRKEKVMEI